MWRQIHLRATQIEFSKTEMLAAPPHGDCGHRHARCPPCAARSGGWPMSWDRETRASPRRKNQDLAFIGHPCGPSERQEVLEAIIRTAQKSWAGEESKDMRGIVGESDHCHWRASARGSRRSSMCVFDSCGNRKRPDHTGVLPPHSEARVYGLTIRSAGCPNLGGSGGYPS